MKILAASLLVFSVYTSAAPIDYATNKTLWDKNNYRPPHFSQSIYKVTILENNKIEIMDGPILLENSQDDMYFIITSDNYDDFAIHVTDTNSTNVKHVQLELTSTEPIRREYDIIILEALDEDLVPVSRSTILLFNSYQQFDSYKMTFKIDDSEYIVLNYHYFKWFLALLTTTGFLILIIELHEIVKNIKTARRNQKYQELQNI